MATKPGGLQSLAADTGTTASSSLPSTELSNSASEKRSHEARDQPQATPNDPTSWPHGLASEKARSRTRRPASGTETNKRKCVSTACIACRKRKSKCDGNLPSCAACAHIYDTPCIYSPETDHRRKGIYNSKGHSDSTKLHNPILETLFDAILNLPEEAAFDLVRQIRACDSLDEVAETALADNQNPSLFSVQAENGSSNLSNDDTATDEPEPLHNQILETQISSRMGYMQLDHGSRRYVGGTSTLVYDDANEDDREYSEYEGNSPETEILEPVTSWTAVTSDRELTMHLLTLYFTWHYPFFTCFSKHSFFRHFARGNSRSPAAHRGVEYCTPLLVNVLLALGCHLSARPAAREDPNDPATAGDHFFKEAKRLALESEEYEQPKLANVQAFALMSLREAGCGREAKGWAYSGISFRMACDLGLNLNAENLRSRDGNTSAEEDDVRRMTFWGCFLFDKCWSNYLGRLPQFQTSTNVTVSKFEAFPDEEAEPWRPFADDGYSEMYTQPARIRTVALQINRLAEISSDLMKYFYYPSNQTVPVPGQIEVKRLSIIHSGLERWKSELPAELDAREGALPSVLTMHMFFNLLFIHLFRPFLKYDQRSSPLPDSVSPRKMCTQAAMQISRILRLYKKAYGLRQICNIVVYMLHSACTIHLLNLSEPQSGKLAKRDFVHGLKHLHDIADSWIIARRTLCILGTQVRRWKIDLPEEASHILVEVESKWGASYVRRPASMSISSTDGPSPASALPNPEMTLDSIAQTAANPPNVSTVFTSDWSSNDISPQSWHLGGNEYNMLDLADLYEPNGRTGNVASQPQIFHPNSSANQMSIMQYQNGYNGFGSTAFPSGPRAAANEPVRVSNTNLMSAAPQQQPLIAEDIPQQSSSQLGPGVVPSAYAHFSQPTAQSGSAAPKSQRKSNGQSSSTNVSSSRKTHAKPSNSKRSTGPTNTVPASPPSKSSSSKRPKPDSSPADPLITASVQNTRSLRRRPSASDAMFGGVQALLREGQEWWVHDQGMVKNGFGRWGEGEEEEGQGEEKVKA